MELAALDQLKKIFYLLKNYFKILAGSQVSDRCLLGYLFSNYFPLQIRTLEICNHDISKTITGRSFKLGQLIEDDKEIKW